jgi:hypothetical protein
MRQWASLLTADPDGFLPSSSACFVSRVRLCDCCVPEHNAGGFPDWARLTCTEIDRPPQNITRRLRSECPGLGFLFPAHNRDENPVQALLE